MNRSPQRAFNQRLRAVGQAIPGKDIEPLCRDLVRRMHHIRLKTQAGTYLFGDSQGFVYVLREQSSTTQAALRVIGRMLVGLYASTKPIFPTAEQLIGDLIAHFTEVGYLTETTLYERIREVEG